MSERVSKTELIELPVGLTTKEEAYQKLKEGISKYLSDEDVQLVEQAYLIAAKHHEGQKRKSGEDYIIHPLCVAMILANLHMDAETIAAGILHDVVEDTDYSIEDLKKDFSDQIALLVEGVTKLTELNLVNDKVEKQAENLRHMFIAMSKDIRVIIIKLADRLHNLKTLEYQTREKQEEKSRETIEIYSPIAGRLGISRIKSQMDDLSLMYLKPKEFVEIQKGIKVRTEAREKFIDEIIKSVKEKLDAANIKAEIKGRVKNLFSIYVSSLDEIYDLFAIRVFVDSIKDCYATLGVIHEYYTPIPGRFKDYIAMPKQNGYQSLHTTVIGKDGIPFEIQIRTYEMHQIAEYGVAAHWAYKEQGNSKGIKDLKELNEMNWLKDILDVNKSEENSKEFLNFVKSDLDLFTEKVFCFTPQGDVVTLPQGSTPVDFAYMIHSAVGYQIKNGDRITILTSGNSNGPSRDWLNIVKSPQAKTKITHWFKKEGREQNISAGKEIIEKYLKSKKLSQEDLFKPEYIKAACKKYTCQNLDDLYAMIGHGGLKESQLISKLKDEFDKDNEKYITDEEVLKKIGKSTELENTVKGGITVKGIDDLAVRYARCCNPVPGDEIIGFVTRGRGITIHRTDCVNILNLPEIEKNRLIEATFQDDGEQRSYEIHIELFCDNRRGLIVDVSKIFTESNIDMTGFDTRILKNDTVYINVGFNINDKKDLDTLKNKLLNVKGVNEIKRA